MFRRVLFLVLAILVAGGTFVLVQGAKKPAGQGQVAPVVEVKKLPHVLVASKSMPAGTFLSAENLEWQAWPDEGLSKAYLTKETTKIADMDGTVLRRAIGMGEPITQNRVIKPGDRGFVAAILQEGKRAISVKVSAASSIAGLAFPGDMVDVILTHAIRQPDDEDRPMRQVSETILKNIRVLAMDQSTDDQTSSPSVPKTATLEVTPKQAEKLMIAVDLGRLSLSLRSLQDTNEKEEDLGASFTLDGEASQLLSKNLSSKKVLVVRGAETEEVITGGTSQ